MPDEQPHFGKWSKEELRNAESTASRFLSENSEPIAEAMRAKARFLEALIQRISNPNAALEERLEYFARISEIAQLIEADANGFFELASQPVVARILGSVPQQ
jgi:aconitase B